MARIRTIKPEFFRSRSLARCSRDARLTFAGLWCDADSAGRGVADARILKGAIWPLDDDITPEVLEEHLAELAREHIVLYEVGGEPYYAIVKFEEHQAASYRQGDAKYPPPPSLDACTPEDASCTPEDATCTVASAVREGKGREGKRIADAPDAQPPDTFLTFWAAYPRKVDRKKACTAWRNLTQADQANALEAIPKHVAAWTRERRGAEFIPHPTSWLHGRRWEDDLAKTTPATDAMSAAHGVQMSPYAQ